MAPADRGLFITLEGGEGAGKSTQAQAVAKQLRKRRFVICVTEEPSRTWVGRTVRSLLSQPEGEAAPLAPLAELFLFEADRAQHVNQIIRPALTRGEMVICDRFTDSSLAYQGFGRGIDLALIRTLNDVATGGLKPDLTLLLDVAPEIGLSREGDQFDVTGREHLEFHKRVREGFLQLAKEEPDRFVVIDATFPLAELLRHSMAAVERLL